MRRRPLARVVSRGTRRRRAGLGGPCRTGHPWFSAPRGVGRRTNGCPALLLFPYSTLVVGLLIRWRLQTTVGPSEEGVTITLAGSIVARGSHHRIKKPRPAPCTSHHTCAHGNHGARTCASLALPDATCLPSSRDGRIEQKGHLRVLILYREAHGPSSSSIEGLATCTRRVQR